MRDFRVIYKILSAYKSMLHDDIDGFNKITPENTGTSYFHMNSIFELLIKSNLLHGANIGSASITLTGLDYLEQNDKMKEIAKEQ